MLYYSLAFYSFLYFVIVIFRDRHDTFRMHFVVFPTYAGIFSFMWLGFKCDSKEFFRPGRLFFFYFDCRILSWFSLFPTFYRNIFAIWLHSFAFELFVLIYCFDNCLNFISPLFLSFCCQSFQISNVIPGKIFISLDMLWNASHISVMENEVTSFYSSFFLWSRFRDISLKSI